MNWTCMRVAVFGAMVGFGTSVAMAQVDPNNAPGSIPGSTPYPQTPQGMNQPGANPTGNSTPATGAQTIPSTGMRESLGNPGESGQRILDKKFVRTAAESGIADIKLGSLAAQKGSPAIKDLAQKMVDDHTTLNKNMENVADSMGVMLPKKMSKEEEAEYDKLNGLSGKDFDAEYLTYITKAHWQNLHAYYMEASVASDPDLQSEVVNALKTMHQHLGMINKTAQDEGITLPPRPHKAAPTTEAKQ